MFRVSDELPFNFSNVSHMQHTDGVDFTTPVHLSTVTIQKSEHDKLVRAKHFNDS